MALCDHSSGSLIRGGNGCSLPVIRDPSLLQLVVGTAVWLAGDQVHAFAKLIGVFGVQVVFADLLGKRFGGYCLSH